MPPARLLGWLCALLGEGPGPRPPVWSPFRRAPRRSPHGAATGSSWTGTAGLSVCLGQSQGLGASRERVERRCFLPMLSEAPNFNGVLKLAKKPKIWPRARSNVGTCLPVPGLQEVGPNTDYLPNLLHSGCGPTADPLRSLKVEWETPRGCVLRRCVCVRARARGYWAMVELTQ